MRNLISKNISVVKAPYGLVSAWYRDKYGEQHRRHDLSLSPFATLEDRILLFVQQADGSWQAARLADWTWHLHYADLVYQCGEVQLAAQVTCLPLGAQFRLQAPGRPVCVAFAINRQSYDVEPNCYGGGLKLSAAGGTGIRAIENWASTYPGAGCFIDARVSMTPKSRAAGITPDPSAFIQAQLEAGGLNGNLEWENPHTREWGVAGFEFDEDAARHDIELGIGYSAQNFALAEQTHADGFACALERARDLWSSYLASMPQLKAKEQATVNLSDFYWKSWAMVAMDGEDHTILPPGKYSFMDTIEYLTDRHLGRVEVGHHKYINAGVPFYYKFWDLDNFWAPATLTFSGQEDVLHSMIKAIFDVWKAQGNVGDTWGEGRDSSWDNYQSFYTPYILRMALALTGDPFYANAAVVENIRKQQEANFRLDGDPRLFHFPLTSNSERKTVRKYPHDKGFLDVARTAGYAHMCRWLVQLKPESAAFYEEEYRKAKESLEFFWRPDGQGGGDYYHRYPDGSFFGFPGIPMSVQILTFLGDVRIGNNVWSDPNYHYFSAPMCLMHSTLLGRFQDAVAMRQRVFEVSDYFSEGIERQPRDGKYWPDQDEAVLHCVYTAHTVILASIGLIPYLGPDENGFVVLPGIQDVDEVTGVHFRGSILDIRYSGKGTRTTLLLDGEPVGGSSGYAKRNFVPFRLLYKPHHRLEVISTEE